MIYNSNWKSNGRESISNPFYFKITYTINNVLYTINQDSIVKSVNMSGISPLLLTLPYTKYVFTIKAKREVEMIPIRQRVDVYGRYADDTNWQRFDNLYVADISKSNDGTSLQITLVDALSICNTITAKKYNYPYDFSNQLNTWEILDMINDQIFDELGSNILDYNNLYYKFDRSAHNEYETLSGNDFYYNFIDTMTIAEVLQQMALYLQVSLMVKDGNIYFVDLMSQVDDLRDLFNVYYQGDNSKILPYRLYENLYLTDTKKVETESYDQVLTTGRQVFLNSNYEKGKDIPKISVFALSNTQLTIRVYKVQGHSTISYAYSGGTQTVDITTYTFTSSESSHDFTFNYGTDYHCSFKVQYGSRSSFSGMALLFDFERFTTGTNAGYFLSSYNIVFGENMYIDPSYTKVLLDIPSTGSSQIINKDIETPLENVVDFTGYYAPLQMYYEVSKIATSSISSYSSNFFLTVNDNGSLNVQATGVNTLQLYTTYERAIDIERYEWCYPETGDYDKLLELNEYYNDPTYVYKYSKNIKGIYEIEMKFSPQWEAGDVVLFTYDHETFTGLITYIKSTYENNGFVAKVRLVALPDNFSIETEHNGTCSLSLTSVNASSHTLSLKYSLDNINWNSLSVSGNTTITSLNEGGIVFIKGTNNSIALSDSAYYRFGLTYYDTQTRQAKYKANGNIMTLLDETGVLTNVRRYSFVGLFRGSNITQAPRFDSILTSSNGYNFYYLFYGCSNMKYAPKLDMQMTTSIGQGTFSSMFYNTGISKFPILKSKKLLTASCYQMCNNTVTEYDLRNVEFLDTMALWGNLQLLYFSPKLTTVYTEWQGGMSYGNVFMDADDNDTLTFTLANLCYKVTSSKVWNLYTDNTALKNASIGNRDTYTHVNVYHRNGQAWDIE